MLKLDDVPHRVPLWYKVSGEHWLMQGTGFSFSLNRLFSNHEHYLIKLGRVPVGGFIVIDNFQSSLFATTPSNLVKIDDNAVFGQTTHA